MDGRDAQRRVLQVHPGRYRNSSKKPDIFGDIDRLEGMRLPHPPWVCQSSQPGGYGSFVFVTKGAFGRRGVVIERAGAARFAFISKQGGYLTAHTVSSIPVIVIPVKNDVSTRFRTGNIAFFSNSWARLQPKIADSRIVGNQIANRVGAVIHDDQLATWVILREECRYRGGDK